MFKRFMSNKPTVSSKQYEMFSVCKGEKWASA